MGILGKDYKEIARQHIYISLRTVGKGCKVACFIIRMKRLSAVVRTAPAHSLAAFKKNVNINVAAMNLQHLVGFGKAAGLGIVDEYLVAIHFYPPCWHRKQVVSLYELEQSGQQRMHGLDTIGVRKSTEYHSLSIIRIYIYSDNRFSSKMLYPIA